MNINPIILIVFALFLGSCKRQAPDPDDDFVLDTEAVKEEGAEKRVEPVEEEGTYASIQEIIAQKDPESIIWLLSEADASETATIITFKDKEGKTLLHHLASWEIEPWEYEQSKFKATILLVEKGADPFTVDLRVVHHYTMLPYFFMRAFFTH